MTGRVRFSVGYDLTEPVRAAILTLPEMAWQPTITQDGHWREDGATVAEITPMLDLSGWPDGSRVLLRRERPHPGAQLSFTDHDGHRFQAILTDQLDTDIAYLQARHRGHARVEDRIRTGKTPAQRSACATHRASDSMRNGGMVHRFKTCCVVFAMLVFVAPATARADVFPFLDDPAVLPVAAQRFELLDFDGDGMLDIAGINRSGDAFLVLGGDDPQVLHLAGLSGRRVGTASGDLTGDGLDDLVAAFDGSGSLAVLHGSADGRLSAPDVYSLRPALTGSQGRTAAVAVGDVDGDGDLDVVAAFGGVDGAPGGVTVLLNDGHGRLTATGPELPVDSPVDIALVKLAGHDDPDLLVLEGTGRLKVFPAAADAGFGAPMSYPTGAYPTSLATGDLNHDGLVDVAIGHDPGYVRVLAGTPSGLVPADGSTPLAGAVAIADVDEDGVDDLYVADGQKTSGWQAAPGFVNGRGDLYALGLVAWALHAGDGGHEREPRIADLDGDGKLDVVTIGDYRGDVLIRFGAGPQLVPNGSVSQLGGTMLTTSSYVSVQFVNEGGGTARNLEIWSDGDTRDFSFDLGDCAGRVLRYGERCTIRTVFTPTELGRQDAEVALVAENSDLVWPLEISGTGVPFVPAPEPPTLNIGSWRPPITSKPIPWPTPGEGGAPPAARPPAAPLPSRVTRRSLPRSGLRFSQFLLGGRTLWTLESKGRVLGRAERVLTAPAVVKVTLRLSMSGRRTFERTRPSKLTLRTHSDRTGLEHTLTVRLAG